MKNNSISTRLSNWLFDKAASSQAKQAHAVCCQMAAAIRKDDPTLNTVSTVSRSYFGYSGKLKITSVSPSGAFTSYLTVEPVVRTWPNEMRASYRISRARVSKSLSHITPEIFEEGFSVFYRNTTAEVIAVGLAEAKNIGQSRQRYNLYCR